MASEFPLTYFSRDVLEVAPSLIGKMLVRKLPDGSEIRGIITETEAYRGEEDLACHASKGRTPRTRVMYEQGGHIYIYLIYGMYYMLNIVTGPVNEPQAVLIRGIEGVNGPGRLTRYFFIKKDLNGFPLSSQSGLWIENVPNFSFHIEQMPRVGIDYAGEIWKNKPWRYLMQK